MKTIKLTEKALKILKKWKIEGECKTYSEAIETAEEQLPLDSTLKEWIPND